VSRRDDEWLADIIEAIAAIRSHLQRGTLSDGLVFDAVRLRLIEIGEAVKRVALMSSLPSPTSRGKTSLACGTASLTATSTRPTP